MKHINHFICSVDVALDSSFSKSVLSGLVSGKSNRKTQLHWNVIFYLRLENRKEVLKYKLNVLQFFCFETTACARKKDNDSELVILKHRECSVYGWNMERKLRNEIQVLKNSLFYYVKVSSNYIYRRKMERKFSNWKLKILEYYLACFKIIAFARSSSTT